MYDELFEAWKREKESMEIQPLPKGFYARLADYVKKISEEKRMLDEKTVKARLLQKEEENVKKIIAKMIKVRYEKIMRVVTSGESVPAATLTEEEEGLYREVRIQADSYQDFLKSILQGRLPKERKPKARGLMVIRILKELPQIIGADMKTYGPFKPEDIASIPEENAKNLIKQGVATEVEIQ